MSDRLPEKDDEIRTRLGEGQAALWLGESLILALVEANLLNTDTVLEAIDIVIAAKKANADGHPDVSRAAATHLASISASIAAARAAPPRAKRRRRPRQKSPT